MQIAIQTHHVMACLRFLARQRSKILEFLDRVVL
jgi:hypothetical protein